MIKAYERLASGTIINRAADHAAGLRIATRLQSQFSGLNEAFDAAQSGINLASVADQALNSVTERLDRIRELSIQAGSSTNDQQARQAIQAEIAQNVDEIDRIASTTQFGSRFLLNGDSSESADGTGEPVNIPSGVNAGQSIQMSFGDVRASSLGLGDGHTLNDINVTEEGGADHALEIVDEALHQINAIRGSIGAFSNRLESGANSLAVISENLLASQSRITDVNIAVEAARLSQNRLLEQVNLSVQSQSRNLQHIMFPDLLR